MGGEEAGIVDDKAHRRRLGNEIKKLKNKKSKTNKSPLLEGLFICSYLSKRIHENYFFIRPEFVASPRRRFSS
jgi:hypothetical protein